MASSHEAASKLMIVMLNTGKPTKKLDKECKKALIHMIYTENLERFR